MNGIGVILLLVIIFFPSQVEGRIFVCTDNDGKRIYSDKKCPVNKKFKTAVYGTTRQIILSDTVHGYTPKIQILRRTLSYIIKQTPENELYQNAYMNCLQAEIIHNKVLTKPYKKQQVNYSPFVTDQLEQIISVISNSCRVDGYMTTCGSIEGFDWLQKEELIYLNKQLRNGLHPLVSTADQKLLCQKAMVANQSGVISEKMQEYFCRN